MYVCFSVHAKIGSEKFIPPFCFCSGHPLLLCSVAMALPLFGEQITTRNSSVLRIIFVSVAYIPHIFPIIISLLLRNMICWIFRLNFFPSFFPSLFLNVVSWIGIKVLRLIGFEIGHWAWIFELWLFKVDDFSFFWMFKVYSENFCFIL